MYKDDLGNRICIKMALKVKFGIKMVPEDDLGIRICMKREDLGNRIWYEDGLGSKI